VILAHLHQLVAHPAGLGFFFQDQDQTVGFGPMALWAQMGWLARGVVIVLFIMSIWSLAVMIDRYLYFAAARKQSREFAPRVAGALREGKLDEAVKVADRNKKSHLAEVVTSGLQEFRNYGVPKPSSTPS
jgi:biopolymer transport protein ExbB/biopolymer transport protein TolQ